MTPAGTTTCTAIPLGAVMLMLPPGLTPGGTVTIISCVGEGPCAGTWTWKVSPGPMPAGTLNISFWPCGVETVTSAPPDTPGGQVTVIVDMTGEPRRGQ